MSSNIKIRRAQPGDEPQLAQVHIQAWQESYKGILPQNFLDQLPSQLESRIEMWKKTLTNPNRWVWVAEDDKIKGFTVFGSPRDENREGYIELGAIYLLNSEKKKGIGFALLSAGFNKMRDLGYKKAYCWTLENNPTTKFYERTGARFANQTKPDTIGGENFTELAYEWNDIDIGDYNWQPLSLPEIKTVFQKFQAPWIIAGGWAIDLFLEKQTREHSDVDVLINRNDQLALQDLLIEGGWEVWVADPPGTLRPLKKGEFLNKGIQDIWLRKNANDPWRFQVMLFDTEENFWIFKRDESIRRELDSATILNKDGFRILSPEIQLLYKSKAIREKDQHDFENAISKMSDKQKRWLKAALIKVYQNPHPWLKVLSLDFPS